MPTVSICLPVYNGAKYLAQALESVLAQTFKDFELVITDDCSTDQSATIINDFVNKDKRIKAHLNKTNLGHYGNYNAALEKATGKYIKLFAQDDLFHPKLLESFVQVFEENPKVNLVNCARAWIDPDGKPIKATSELDIKLTKPFARNTKVSGTEAIISTLKEAINWLGEPSSQMFRAEFLDGGFDTSFRQIGDLEYNYRLLEKGDYFFVADYFCNFRKHLDSWTTTNSKELSTYLEWLVLASKYQKYLPQTGLTPEEYCLKFLKDWSRNLEEKLFQEQRFSKEEIAEVLRELTNNSNPLTLFDHEKNIKRDLLQEYKALGAIALLQSALFKNELRLVSEEVARPYNEVELKNKTLLETQPGLVIALQALKETLQERDKEIEMLRKTLTEMGSSLSWKVTEPLRKFKNRL